MACTNQFRGNDIPPEIWELAIRIYKGVEGITDLDVGNAEDIANVLLRCGIGSMLSTLSEIAADAPSREVAQRLASDVLENIRKTRDSSLEQDHPIF